MGPTPTSWSDPSLRPSPILELELWRETTTIFMNAGPGGCEPYGLSLALRRRGLSPEIFVSRPPPYFLDTVHSEDQRRVMRLVQDEFRRDAVETAWQIVMPILNKWQNTIDESFPNYSAGSQGPPSADRLLAMDGREWRKI